MCICGYNRGTSCYFFWIFVLVTALTLITLGVGSTNSQVGFAQHIEFLGTCVSFSPLGHYHFYPLQLWCLLSEQSQEGLFLPLVDGEQFAMFSQLHIHFIGHHNKSSLDCLPLCASLSVKICSLVQDRMICVVTISSHFVSVDKNFDQKVYLQLWFFALFIELSRHILCSFASNYKANSSYSYLRRILLIRWEQRGTNAENTQRNEHANFILKRVTS